jgi:hypothetical protein
MIRARRCARLLAVAPRRARIPDRHALTTPGNPCNLHSASGTEPRCLPQRREPHGRDRVERLVAIRRNRWSPSAGSAGRHPWNAHAGAKIGLCGQAPSDHPEFAAFLVSCGIDSISVGPDSFIAVKRKVAEAEAKKGRP